MHTMIKWGFTPEIQRWFIIHQSVNVIHQYQQNEG